MNDDVISRLIEENKELRIELDILKATHSFTKKETPMTIDQLEQEKTTINSRLALITNGSEVVGLDVVMELEDKLHTINNKLQVMYINNYVESKV